MRALNRKLLRDLWHHRGPMLSIAAVVAAATMTVLSMRGTYESLVIARDSYYEQSRFPDIWASLERAPESLKSGIQGLDGVSAVDTRVSFMATVRVEGLEKPATGFFSTIDREDVMLGRLHLRSGRLPGQDERDRVVISEQFAKANELVEGSTVRAVLNGQLRELEVLGIGISPEHTYPLAPGSIFPDNQTYGVFWMGRNALSELADMEGAFNQVALTMQAGAKEAHVISELDAILKPYGGLGAHGRDLQVSHQFLESELSQNRTTGTFIPAVFLAVVAFLLNMVLRRLIATQRQEIAVLKAFGYTNADVGSFYLRMALFAVFLGAAIGSVVGYWLGDMMVELYTEFFVFPDLQYRLSGWLLSFAFVISALAAGIGAMAGVRQAVSLPPAEAMRPQAPASFRPGIFERIGFARFLSSSMRMVLRNIERQPVKSIFSAIGVSFSVAILVVGMFLFDGIDYMMDLQFNRIQREDLSVSFERPVSPSVLYELQSLEGVSEAEIWRSVPARLISGHRRKEVGITGRHLDDDLRRIIKEDGLMVRLPAEGLVISRFLADALQVEAGSILDVEVLIGQRPVRQVAIQEVVDDFLGVSAFMEIDALHRLAGGIRSVNGANLKVEAGRRESVSRALADVPAVADVSSPRAMYESFRKQMDEGFAIGVFFLVLFSSIIALAVIYNGARISLSERGRELASLRVLGFSKQEVALLLFSEQGLITLIAIPIGWALGYWLAFAMVQSLITETYRIPFVVDSGTYLASAAMTVLAALLSSWVVRRRLNRYDLISVLKTRD